MATYRELIYSVLDRIKAISDDSIITEDHVIFTIDKVRAALLYQKYGEVKREVIESNYQTLCLDLEQVVNSEVCGEIYMRTTKSIPSLLNIGNTSIYPLDFYKGNIAFVSKERMKYVGYNKFLQNVIYASLNPDGRVYLKSKNPQFLYLEKISVTGIFENAMEASELECSQICEPWDRIVPIEEDLIPVLIETVVKDLLGALYRPADEQNNMSDDLANIYSFIKRNIKSGLQKQIEE